MYKDIFESIRNEAEKRNLRERTIQLYCSDVSYFLRWIGKNVSDLTLEDAESFLTAKRLEGRSPETHNHYRSAIIALCFRLSGVKIAFISSRDRTAGRFRSLFIAGTVSSSQTVFSTFLYKNFIADR